ncbi:MAG: prepilin-type N-terminal cleavage/methylation domain-containing protein [Patescibacteria group bacterium]
MNINKTKFNYKKSRSHKKGFTLIEILVVIGIIAVLAGVVLVAVNPARQFKLARDSQRTSNVTALLSAIGQNIAEHKGIFTCTDSAVTFSSATTTIKHDSTSGGVDIAPCIVPNYISSLPYDPASTTAFYTSTSTYNTAYSVSQDTDGRITVSANGELTPMIFVTR